MATRLLLTLLAVLTGLAAQLNPANARSCASAGSEINVVATPGAAQGCAVAAVIGRRLAAPKKRRDEPRHGIGRAAPVPIPAVLQGIDRARE